MDLLRDIETRRKLSSGSTLLNLACSGYPNWAAISGRYYWMVGDSSSGKTFWTLTFLAEASINPDFDNYDLIFDDVEGGALMNVEKFFGPKLARRLQPPRVDEEGNPLYSEVVEDFYFNLDDRFQQSAKTKRPFIYLLDSMDALDTKYSGEKFQERKKAARKGTEAKGDYGDGKAQLNSRWLRKACSKIREHDCILIILSQTRDNMDAGMFEEQSISAGGRALKFYTGWQLWSSIGARLKTEVEGNTLQIGIMSRLKIKKNRLSGKEWQVSLPIYWSHGIDDIGGCVEYLLEWKHWEKDRGVITVPEWNYKGKIDQLIKKIEDEDLEVELRDIVADVWREVEKKATDAVPSKKNKYQEG
jgi:hypothetical protein